VDTYDVTTVRSRFPALVDGALAGEAVDLDGPAGTQVPESVIEAMAAVHREGISNVGAGFPASASADRITSEARSAVADLFNAGPDEIVFGQNMTSLTFSISRALSREWADGDEIVVTLLDHDANVTPWRLAAEDRGATVRCVPFDRGTGLLDMGALADAVGPRTRLVAITHASNALGTIPDVRAVNEIAHRSGALSYVDAVHFTPHGIVDVASLDCDFLVASTYKFYGPHLGALYARRELLEHLRPYKVIPAPDDGPARWETGTQNFEALAGATAAVDHIATLGDGASRRDRLIAGQRLVEGHETALARRFLTEAAGIARLRVYGIKDPSLLAQRVPTFSIGIEGVPAAETASLMRDRGLSVRAGHFYATGLMQHLGVHDDGGLVRIGFVQYNTADEVGRTLDTLASIASSGR